MATDDRLSVDLGPLKASVMQCAAGEGMAAAAWVRRALEQALREAGTRVEPRRPVVRSTPGAGRVKFGAMLSAQASAALGAAAAREGLSQAEYLDRLLTGRIVEQRADVVAQLQAVSAGLMAAQRQLAAASDGPDGEALTRTARELRRQAKAASMAMAGLVTNRRSAAQRKSNV